MTATPVNRRDPVAQERLNAHMRRPEVLQYLLHEALHADPATPEQVRAFLETAPPDVFVALDGLLPVPVSDLPSRSVHDDPIAQGFVGLILSGSKPGGERSEQPGVSNETTRRRRSR